MRVLALDTTTRAGGIALVEDDRVVAAQPGDSARTHGERLPGEILALLAEHHCRTSDVDVFAVAAGPGSFTGLRVGIATIQGLAFVHGRPIVAVSALEASAQAATADAQDGAIVGVWMDAHRRDVFTALYRIQQGQPRFDAGRLVQLDGPAVGDPAGTLLRWARSIGGERVQYVGDGAVRYATVIRSQQPDALILDPPLLAGAVGLMAVRQAAEGQAIAPAAVRPLYVRRPDAEMDRERRRVAKDSPDPTSGKSDTRHAEKW
jgi:tRNA threonylcarbamoyladenosine biosynthesis protein TsaB